MPGTCTSVDDVNIVFNFNIPIEINKKQKILNRVKGDALYYTEIKNPTYNSQI